MRGSDCSANSTTYIGLYKPIYTRYTKNAHWCYISPVRGGAVSQLIAMKFDILRELTYVINFTKFGVDRSVGEQSNIRFLPLLEKPSLALHNAAVRAVISLLSSNHSLNEWINESMNQSINQSINRSIFIDIIKSITQAQYICQFQLNQQSSAVGPSAVGERKCIWNDIGFSREVNRRAIRTLERHLFNVHKANIIFIFWLNI